MFLVILYVNDIHHLSSPTRIFTYNILVINPVSPSRIPETLFKKVSNESKIIVLHIVVEKKY